MNRNSRRISRPFIALLALMILAGGIAIVVKLAHAHGSAPEPQAVTPAPQAVLPAPSPAPEPAAMNPAPVVHPAPMPTVAAGPTGALSPTVARVAPIAEAQPAADVTSDAVDASQKKLDGGDFVGARAVLNDALQAGQLDPNQAAAARQSLAQINQVLIFSKRPFPDDPYGGTYVVQPGDNLARIASAHDITWEMLARINGITPNKLRSGATIKIVEGPFFAVVSKHAFTIDLYLGGLPGEKSSMFVASYPVGLGRDDSTPTGTWMIEPHHKLKHPTYYSPRGEGVIAADDPKNPLGGYWIGLTGADGQALGKTSYGIHGTIDPDSIGKQSSMGCIRLNNDDIPVVFDMMVEGKSLVQVQN